MSFMRCSSVMTVCNTQNIIISLFSVYLKFPFGEFPQEITLLFCTVRLNACSPICEEMLL